MDIAVGLKSAKFKHVCRGVWAWYEETRKAQRLAWEREGPGGVKEPAVVPLTEFEEGAKGKGHES